METDAGTPSMPRYFIQALAKGLSMLQVFDPQHPSMTLSELGRALGLHKATARRFAQTLVDLGFLELQPDRRYRLGPRTLDLGHRYLSTLNLPNLAQPYMQEAVRQTGETVNLAIRDGKEIVYLARIAAAPRILGVSLQVGSRLPVHATALGKALLAGHGPEDLVAILGDPPWTAFTPATRTTPEALLEDLRKVQKDGFALNDGELEPGLRSLAAPVRNLTGDIVAALNISTSTARVSLGELLGPMKESLLEATSGISRSLGNQTQVS